MFNSMNSIRALIDEEPNKAKDAVTQLANLLRSTLLTGKKKLISFSEELKLVKDYLALEKIRYEERLQIVFEIDSKVNSAAVPPLMLLTLVENGIKHGISHLPKGGKLKIAAFERKNYIEICILNSGVYNPNNNNKGTHIGIVNTRKRLQLLFGNKSRFTIENIPDNNTTIVKTQVLLPLANKNQTKIRKNARISN